MTQDKMKQQALSYIQEIRSFVPEGHPWHNELSTGESAILSGHEVTYGDLGNLTLILAAVKAIGGIV